MEQNNELLLDQLLNKTSEYIKNIENLEKIKKAYYFAKEKHLGQFRKSGEDYIIHPTEVALILASFGVGPDAICAGLLHDVLEDTQTTYEIIEKEFGSDVAFLVEGVTKISKLSFEENTISDNQQKMLIAMAKDIRVIIIKIADRLHNMRTLQYMSPEKQISISNETLDIYAPIAHRLGMFRIKSELEDRSLRYTNPEMYSYVSKKLASSESLRENTINEISKNIQIILEKNHVQNPQIKGRIKNIYSIYKKMANSKKTFDDIYDLLAIRIIVDKVEECYHALGLIHANFTPLPKRFKDYIAVPKPNLYQSLHTTVLSEDETLFEVQIRTQEMDDVAENGIAAHFAYKEQKVYSKEKEQFEIASRLKWYGELLKLTEDIDQSSNEFVEMIKGDILTANIYVFTPKGSIIELQKGCTPIDFAYKIHTDVGHKMVGAKVNNKIAPLSQELQTGDIVTVLTNNNSLGPSEDWLKVAKSTQALHKIRAFINLSNKDKLTILGQEILEKELKLNRVLDLVDDAFVFKHFGKANVKTLQDLYFEVGKNTISPKGIVSRLNGSEPSKEDMLQRQIEKTTRSLTTTNESGVVILGIKNPKIKLGSCCFPIPGDEIIAYVSKTQGFVIHNCQCKNFLTLDKKRETQAFWASNITRKYPVGISIIGANKPDLLNNIISCVNMLGISIAEFNSTNKSGLEVVIKIKVTINNLNSLNNLLANLQKANEVFSVERLYT